MTNTATTESTARLYDFDTAEDLGPATLAQIAASNASDLKGENGAILVDAEGDLRARRLVGRPAGRCSHRLRRLDHPSV